MPGHTGNSPAIFLCIPHGDAMQHDSAPYGLTLQEIFRQIFLFLFAPDYKRQM
jgi:hypothetical protein